MTSPAEDAKALVRAASLTPIEHKILCQIIIDDSYAADSVAKEITTRIKAHPGSAIEDVLRSIKADWHSIISQGSV